MKRLLLITLFSFVCILGFSQNKGVLKFLDIPIDGPVSQFTTKLRAKGFTYNSLSERYQGQFNGKSVEVLIHTNHNLVDRVIVLFPSTTERSIKTEFNHLLSQLEDNSKYMSLGLNDKIPEDEDISHEILVHDKEYEASFIYIDPDTDPVALSEAVLAKMSSFYTEDELANISEYFNYFFALSEEEQKVLTERSTDLLMDSVETIDSEQAILYLATLLDAMQSVADGNVWFKIFENGSRYQIVLYYDNIHNQAHGEDL